MFGKQSKPCRVYVYGCLSPTQGEEAMLTEMRRRNDYWNKLVEIEHEYRAKVREAIAVPDDPVAALRQERDALREEIKASRNRNQTRKVDVDKLKTRIAEIKAVLPQVVAETKEKRKAMTQANKETLDKLEKERQKKAKEARKASGLYWCNYDSVEKVYNTARQRAMREGKNLKFHRWTGEGKLSLRWQQGLPVEQVFSSNNTMLQIDPVPVEAWESPVRSIRRKAARTVVRFRICSDETRRPVWAEFPCVLHRPLPFDEEIRSAEIIRERAGNSYRYKLAVTVTNTQNRVSLPRPKTAIAIDLGWRLVQDGLRVAYWVDTEGEEGEVILPARDLAAFDQVEQLRSWIDEHFNAAKEVLTAWLASRSSVPDWLTEATKTLAQWRSPSKITWLLQQWHENRFPGDQEPVAYLEEWAKRNQHLYTWQANLRDKVKKRRREQYLIFAANLTRQYNYVFMENFDLRKVAKNKEAEEGMRQEKSKIHRVQHIAAPSTLRLAIKNACERDGVKFQSVLAKHTTNICSYCGHREKWDTARWLYHTCPKCGTTYDQDVNAARNILSRGLSQIEEGLEQENDFRKNVWEKEGDSVLNVEI